MAILFVALALFFGYGSAYVLSEDVRYLSRAGIEETRILQHRKPLEKLLADSSLAPATRAQLGLVVDVRRFATTLGLKAGETYTTFSDVGRDTLLLVLSASPKDCICPYMWKYPIVGRIPYKGFFDPKMAQKEADRLAEKRYDIYLRPAAAFSTLGWFNDPLLSTALTRDSVEMAALVFHEIAHNTLYVNSATSFNESFAQLVGYRAAESYFTSRGDSVAARRARERWLDEIILDRYYADLLQRLEGFYGTKPAQDALDSGRVAISGWARDQLQGPVGAQLRTYSVGVLAERPINNARLVGIRLYRTHLDWFEQWFEAHGADVSVAVKKLRDLMVGAVGDSAFARLGRGVAGSPH